MQTSYTVDSVSFFNAFHRTSKFSASNLVLLTSVELGVTEEGCPHGPETVPTLS